jgi:hypothetical protein
MIILYSASCSIQSLFNPLNVCFIHFLFRTWSLLLIMVMMVVHNVLTFRNICTVSYNVTTSKLLHSCFNCYLLVSLNIAGTFCACCKYRWRLM